MDKKNSRRRFIATAGKGLLLAPAALSLVECRPAKTAAATSSAIDTTTLPGQSASKPTLVL
ncbi:MAG TPA: hypothetical protein VLD19_16445, partial [Chitinophagaceae bacterium]|nr:hypothetical protein [Chitinophagaceae bacterium]